MPCSCQKKREQFAVVTAEGKGRQVYQNPDKNLAIKIAKKYPQSVVKDPAGTVVFRQSAETATASTGTGDPREKAE
ncbi:hypothetical protein GR925_27420 [Streptomyces sp. HUCO-GS316]|uniref:hypothetical protein n=1 Tax=Streptomyces sp. HUCO-GS316 TaxID=2692198 RepID=UPI00136A859A|nr:hypothetical protein [Streptomyces sp. HUCO-GS316]MXM67059.1 hypothetical protein [Streptomyces sp. HUCO-GS316]